MSIDDATPSDWDRANQSSHIKEYVDPFDAPTKSDPVNCPDHYNAGKLECIDAIEASMSVEAFKGLPQRQCREVRMANDIQRQSC